MFRIHPSMDECWINEMDVCVNVCMYVWVMVLQSISFSV